MGSLFVFLDDFEGKVNISVAITSSSAVSSCLFHVGLRSVAC